MTIQTTMNPNSQFSNFRTAIIATTRTRLEAAAEISDLLIEREGRVTVHYAPFEHLTPGARLAIVGITPGRTQMINAVIEAQRALKAGASDLEALRCAKLSGAFSGGLRANLIRMLDAVGANRYLGLNSCARVFDSSHAGLVHTTSVLRNPVFVDGANYNGTPAILRTAILRRQLEEVCARELNALQDALVLPLGPKVHEALRHLAERGLIDSARVLPAMPHPSGANNERIGYFLGTKPADLPSQKARPDELVAARNALREAFASFAR